MSAIAAGAGVAGAIGSSLTALLAQNAQRQRVDKDGASAGAISGAGTNGGGFATHIAEALKAVGITDPAKVQDLQSQIQAAIKDASKNGKPSRQAIKDAVNGVLKQNGIDPTKFEAALQSQSAKARGAGGHHHHKGGDKTVADPAADPTRASNLALDPGSLVDIAA